MIRLKDFFTKSVLRAETIKSQDVVNDANNETETLGLKFTPNYMPYEEKKPYYETGLKKFIENSELNSLNQIKTIVAIPNSSETKMMISMKMSIYHKTVTIRAENPN